MNQNLLKPALQKGGRQFQDYLREHYVLHLHKHEVADVSKEIENQLEELGTENEQLREYVTTLTVKIGYKYPLSDILSKTHKGLSELAWSVRVMEIMESYGISLL